MKVINGLLIQGLIEFANFKNTDFKIFGKPNTRMYRRMGITQLHGTEIFPELVLKVKEMAGKIKVN